MLGSIDCMHLDRGNCPKALHAQFKIRDHKYPTLMLEAIAVYTMWIWHAYYILGWYDDLNVLYGSLLFDDLPAAKVSKAPFVVNRKTYNKGYYLTDGIYPWWSTFVKTYYVARDEKTMKFKNVQESSRKDTELQGRWGIIQ